MTTETLTMNETCGCPEGRGLSRRTLMRRLAAGGALGATLTVLEGFSPAARFAFAAEPASYAGDVLVVLSLRGGFDGLNAIVPAGDPAYATARPTIGVPTSRLIGADGIFGLHPGLAPLEPFWKAGTFGAVHAVGQPNPTRSHFQAMEELERAAPGSSLRTGWLDRTVGTRADAGAFQAVQAGSSAIPASLRGPNPEMALDSVKSFAISGAWDDGERARWTTALRAMAVPGAPAPIADPARAALAAAGTTAALAAKTYQPSGEASYPDTHLGKALRDVAQLIKAGIGLQVATVDEGDWDMHAGMGQAAKGGWMYDHLHDLAAALAAFATDLKSDSKRDFFSRVTLVTLSEFGRRVGENGSGGVDHGHGNAVLLLGGGVNGGKVHGRWPGLADEDLVDGDLAGATDYRLVLGEILTARCGASSLGDVFPGLTGDALGVVRPRS
ncbi:DUF1501 domain-containing protein [Spongisporangium articulatum]|uniref:DUF1501 domain-containing protein n=1 Tax=Spongisporangium articulatum TaxID=3362603 RepID=A0ABW8AJH5_9ACTN